MTNDPQPLINGLTRSETDASASVAGLSQKCWPNGMADDPKKIRVVCVTRDGSTYVLPANGLSDAMDEVIDDAEDDDEIVYAIKFKTMSRAEFDALGEFDGF